MMVCVPTALAGTSRCTFQSARDPRDQTLCPNPSSNSSYVSCGLRPASGVVCQHPHDT